MEAGGRGTAAEEEPGSTIKADHKQVSSIVFSVPFVAPDSGSGSGQKVAVFIEAELQLF